MAIITKPTVTRGVPATFELNKGDLAAHPDVLANPYFSSISTWGTVSLHYKSDVRVQHSGVQFYPEQAAPEGTFIVSQYSQGDFLIDHLTINDHDGGKLIIPRANLVTANFDVIFS